MKYVGSFIFSLFFNLSFLFSEEKMNLDSTKTSSHTQKVSVIGGGIIGALESYYAHLDAKKNNKEIEVVVYEKSSPFDQTQASKKGVALTNTAYNIFASLTPDEILSVVPRGSELVEKLAILFSEPGGIRVDDVPGVNDSVAAQRFKEAVELYGADTSHEDRTKNLLLLGKMSMDLWQEFYQNGDEELKSILRESNYNPCQNPLSKETEILHNGYRIDLIYDVSNAEQRASDMQSIYKELGYDQCKILSPSEVIAIDPSLIDFCKIHSECDICSPLVWKSNASALWRPGGCISAHLFLPKFYEYLKKKMGTYQDSSGQLHNYFEVKFNKEVVGVNLNHDSDLKIIGLKFADGSYEEHNKENIESSYIFCPGEAVGTLNKLGFDEPTYAGFAGPSLTLEIPLSPEEVKKYKYFNHFMEVHKVGVILAWQARLIDDKIIIGVAGTKAFYGDQEPTIDQDFAKNRNLLQLNMVNDVLPEMVSLACGHDTRGVQFSLDDLYLLQDKGFLKRWVGRRGVAYDGFPTLGFIYAKGEKISNARCTTHLGSGGVSFALGAIELSRKSGKASDPFTIKLLEYADSRRKPKARSF